MTDEAPDPIAPADASGPVGSSRWMKIALIVSLAVNLAVLGAIGGTALHGLSDRGGPKMRDLGFGPFTEALSVEDRVALAKSFMTDGGNPRAMRREMRAEFSRLLDAVRAEPFDEVHLREVFATLQARGRERLDLGQRLLSDRIVAMTPEARQRFAERLEDILSRGPRRGPPPPTE